MNVSEVFIGYATAFEETYRDDDWQRLSPYFHEDATYEVCNMPFHCALRGREAIFRGIKRSLDGFDRKCQRTLPGPSVFKEEGDKVLVFGGVVYEREGSQTSATLWEIATIKDDQICSIVDIYSPGDAENYEKWISQWDDGLSAAYC